MASSRNATAKAARTAREITLAPGDEVQDAHSTERFRIVSLLAEGGMGRVFRAQRLASGEICAVKCHRPIDAENTALRKRLENEGLFLKALGRAKHICPVLASGVRDDGLSWIAMPLLNGASVGQLLEVIPRIPLVWTLEVVRAVCIALAQVRGKAIHRDIKPENIFITREGGVFVLDWGAGKFYGGGRLTTTGTTIGTIAFMSPEQLTDPEHLTPQSDLFSTGVTFFMMLCGTHPFDPDGPLQGNAFAIAHRILEAPPRQLPEGLPGYVEEVVCKFLQKSPRHRHRSPTEAAEVVDAALNRCAADYGQRPPLAWIFDAYDRGLGAAQAAQQAEQSRAARATEAGHADTAKASAQAPQGDPALTSGIRRTLRTAPSAGGTIPMGPANRPAAQDGRARGGGTIPMGPAHRAAPPIGRPRNGTIPMGPAPAAPPAEPPKAAPPPAAPQDTGLPFAETEPIPMGPRPNETEPIYVGPRPNETEPIYVGPRSNETEPIYVGPRSNETEPIYVGPRPNETEPSDTPEPYVAEDEPSALDYAQELHRPPERPEAPLRPKEPGAVPLTQVEDEDRTARLLAIIHALGDTDHPDARDTLLAVLETYEDSPVLRAAAAAALARNGDESCIEALEVRTAYDLHPMVRRVAEDARAAILTWLGDPERPRKHAPLDLKDSRGDEPAEADETAKPLSTTAGANAAPSTSLTHPQTTIERIDRWYFSRSIPVRVLLGAAFVGLVMGIALLARLLVLLVR